MGCQRVARALEIGFERLRTTDRPCRLLSGFGCEGRPFEDIKAWHVGASSETKNEIGAQLGGFDLIVSQMTELSNDSPLNFQRLQETHKSVLFLPNFVFRGFHPDCIYMMSKGKFLEGPLHHYHSGIIAAAYAAGFPANTALHFFNALAYSYLGYFEEFGVALDLALQNFAEAGFDLTSYFDRFKLTKECFMHTVNHPRVQVLAWLAHMIAVRSGLIDVEIAAPNDLLDTLEVGIQWPIYPQIARRLAMSNGGIVYRRANRQIGLEELITGSYQSYDKLDRDELRSLLPTSLQRNFKAFLAA